jgi:sugar lactone lactonase YvrE
MRFIQVRVIGGQGSGPERFASTLCGIWIDRQDRLHAAGDSQVKAFDTTGRLLRRWGTAKPAASVAVSGDGSLYVGQAAQVEIFDKAGPASRVWLPEAQTGQVTAIGFLDDEILLADAKDRAIRRYDKSLNLINTIGKDNRLQGFLIPNGVLDFGIDSAGIIHAANPGKHRVERYTRDGRLLGHIGRFDGQDPSGFPGCCNPTNLAVGPSGSVYVTEKAGPRVKALDRDGNLLSVIATTAFDPGCKNMAIAVDSQGRVYVADTVKLQIVVFERTEEKAS